MKKCIVFFFLFLLFFKSFAQVPIPIEGQKPIENDDDLIEIPVEDLPGYQKPDKQKLNRSKRVGAKCKDGTYSDKAGTGACSQHGGVLAWVYEDTVSGERFEHKKQKRTSKKSEKPYQDENGRLSAHETANFWHQPFGIFMQFALAVITLLVIVLLIRKII